MKSAAILGARMSGNSVSEKDGKLSSNRLFLARDETVFKIRDIASRRNMHFAISMRAELRESDCKMD